MKEIRSYFSHVFYWLATLILFFQSPTFSQTIGKYGAPFLFISPYARQVAMGEAFTALANDINVMRYNVGGLGNLRHIMFSAHYHKWIEDTEQGALEVSLPWRYGVAGFNLTYFNEGSLTELDEQFVPTGQVFANNDLSLSFGYGAYLRLFNNLLSFGAGVKVVRQDLAGESATGTGVDVGMLYSLKVFSVGLTVQNLTVSKLQFDKESYLLPETLRGGLAARLPIRSNFKLNLVADAAKLLGDASNDIRVYSGAELRIGKPEVFALRGGYKFHDNELSRWGAGFGVIIPMNWLGRSSTELDYAYSPMGAFDQQAHRFSLSFSFGAQQPVQPIAGMSPEEFAAMQQQVSKELEAAEQARRAAEEARLSASETEKRLKDLEAEMAARLRKIMEIAEKSGGKIEVQPREEGNILMTLRINFDFDKSNIRQSEYETMFRVVDILQTYPEAKVGISGHTDDIGTDEYNFKLSEARMNSVMNFLERQGISRDRFFMPVPYGEWRHLTGNRNERERERNRRVEFYMYTGTNKPLIPDGTKIDNVVVMGDSVVSIVGNGRLNFLDPSFLDNPPRLVFKFPKVYITEPKTIPINRGNFIRARMAYHPDERSTWVVFDLQRALAPTRFPRWFLRDQYLMIRLRGDEPAPPSRREN
ncbi:MAG: PorV/PorQ family protein [candidate division KSB1 bacterium]|nr:PorV/PorQ family protein [candidate division KSB1 bacterium]